jgi:drug/metabolite transporter (DMT)-like permease
MPRRTWLLFAAMCVIWGIPYLLIRVAVRDLSPAVLVFARTAVGGLVLLPVALRAGGFRQLLPHWRALLAFTVAELAIPWLLLSDAETKLSSAVSGLLVAAVPLVGVLIALVVGGGDRVDARRLIGLLIGFAGVACLVGLDLGQVDPLALFEVAVVVVGYALGPMISARRLSTLPSAAVISSSLLLTAIGYLPVAIIQRPAHVHADALASVLVLGLICTALAFILFFALIAEIGPSRATVITYVNPAVAIVLGSVFLSERITLGMAVGFPLILGGCVLGARPPRPPDQSMLTGPCGVSNPAMSTPVSSSSASLHSTSTPSNG